MKNVVVLGATPRNDRFAYRAMVLLQQHGHRAIPVNPAFEEILEERCYASVSEVPEPIDTLTMYVGAARSAPLIDDIIRVKPRRIIFNPGAENDEFSKAAQANGIEAINACTLVMLQTGSF